MLGKLNSDEVETLLASQVVGRIGCHANDTTFIVPISYAYDGDCIYALTQEGLKVRLMRKNPCVCFEVDQMQDMGNWKTVIACGEFEELNDEVSRNKALQLLANRMLPLINCQTTHLFPDWPFVSDLCEIRGILFRIRITEKSGRFENNNGSPCLIGRSCKR